MGTIFLMRSLGVISQADLRWLLVALFVVGVIVFILAIFQQATVVTMMAFIGGSAVGTGGMAYCCVRYYGGIIDRLTAENEKPKDTKEFVKELFTEIRRDKGGDGRDQ